MNNNKKMINSKKSILSLFLVAISTFFQVTNVFAEGGYGIVYQGGEELSGENVTIDPDLIHGLTHLLGRGTISNLPNDATRWESAYARESLTDGSYRCIPYYYFRVTNDNPVTSADNIGMTLSNDKYEVDIKVKSAVLEGFQNDVTIAFSIVPQYNTLYAGWNPYFDSECTQRDLSVNYLTFRDENGGVALAELNMKIRKKGQDELFMSDELYFNLTDIDAAQSFKILNEGNKLVKNNMFAVSEEILQDTNPETTLKNYYVPDGNYIYSDYTHEAQIASYDTDVFVKLNRQTQEDGLDIVLGYAASAGSGIAYFVKQYVVQYETDENGDLIDIDSEDVFSGDNPSSSETVPKEGYRLVGWRADRDVALANGTVVRAGEIITLEQIRSVVVHEDIVFRAAHERIGDDGSGEDEDESTPVVPNTGSNTENSEMSGMGSFVNEMVVAMSVVLIVFCCCYFRHRSTCHFEHRK